MNRTPNDKIQISRSFDAVWCKAGTNECPNPAWHFRGCAREVFSYLELIRSKNNHGGFLFMSVADIIAHTKDWANGRKPFSERQVKRVLAAFQLLGVIGKYETRMIKGRAVKGWQMSPHGLWAKVYGGTCHFKYWPDFEPNQRKLMHNERNGTDNGTANGTDDVTPNGTDLEDNGTANGTDENAVISVK